MREQVPVPERAQSEEDAGPQIRESRLPDPRIQCFVDAYAEHVTRVAHDDETGAVHLVMHNGARVLWDDGVQDKSHSERLANPDLEDTLYVPYPRGATVEQPPVDSDPGRVRHEAFFKSVYGDSAAEIQRSLRPVSWGTGGQAVPFQRGNGAREALQRVANELETTSLHQQEVWTTLAGTWNWRVIAGTDRLSAHAFAIAIDLNVAFADYWRWASDDAGRPRFRNRVPAEIVDVFERHGFIWGGRWYHHDTMHFEYRPELLHPACVGR